MKVGKMTPPLRLVDLESDEQIDAAFPLMSVLRPHLQRDAFVPQIHAQSKESGYRLTAGFTGGGQLVVLAGYKPATTLSRGPHLFIDDLVTHPDHQRNGYAKALLTHVARRAKDWNLPTLWLDSRATAKTFYEQVGFTMHTSIPCFIDVDALLSQSRSDDKM
jgi:GNAT superfamily N-acetyltransferase